METIANLKSFFTEKVHTDSFVFRLHYRLTVVVFLALSSLTTSKKIDQALELIAFPFSH